MPTYDPDAAASSYQGSNSEEATRLPFGKYKGWPVTSVPDASYLEWLYDAAKKEWLKECLAQELQRRQGGGLLTPPPDFLDRNDPFRDATGAPSAKPPAQPKAPALPESVYRAAEQIIEHGTGILLDHCNQADETGTGELAAEVQRAGAELAKMLAARGKERRPDWMSAPEEGAPPF